MKIPSADMGKFIAPWMRSVKSSRRPCCWCITRGTRSRDRARGASALFAAVDFAWQLDVQGDRRVLTTTKAKDHEALPPMAFASVPASAWAGQGPRAEEELSSVVLEHVGTVRTKPAARLTGQTRLALDVLHELAAWATGPSIGLTGALRRRGPC